MKKLLLTAAIAILALSACATPGDGVPGPRLTFEHYAPMTLNVSSSAVSEHYEVPNDPQDVSGQFVVAPSEAIKQYAAHRFPANGRGNGLFTIEILDARVHLDTLKQNNAVLGWSGVGQEDQYRVFLKLKVTPVPDQSSGRASTVQRMERTLVMPSSVTLAEREMRQLKFLEKLIADVDVNIQTVLDQAPAVRQ